MAGIKFLAPLEITVPVGTAPIESVSTTLCANLNADRLDGLEAAAFATAVHTHSWAEITGEPTTLAGYGITDGATDAELAAAVATLQPLDSDLTAIAALAPSQGAVMYRGAAGWAALAAGSNGQVLFSRGAGADPAWDAVDTDVWTYAKLAADFDTTSGTAVDVTGLGFTPAAGKTYHIEGQFLLRTSSATVGARAGIAWPTGLTDGVASIISTNTTGAMIFANGNINNAFEEVGTQLPNATASWPCTMWATVIAGASPSGDFKITLFSETAGTQVTMKAGSWIRYREI